MLSGEYETLEGWAEDISKMLGGMGREKLRRSLTSKVQFLQGPAHERQEVRLEATVPALLSRNPCRIQELLGIPVSWVGAARPSLRS